MDQSGQSGQGGRPGSDPTGSTGGTSSGWQSTPGSTGSAGGGTGGGGTTVTGGGTAGGGAPGGTSGGWQSTPPSSGSSAPPTWQSTPEQTPAQTGGSWERPATSGSAPAVPGTAGYYYADVPNRAIAYIIDAVILGIIGIIVGIVLTPIIGPTATFTDPNDPLGGATINTGAVLISAIVSTIINGLYFVGSWITWRATPGQRVLGMQVGNETDGATLTTNQALTRWVLLGAPFGIASALTGVSGLGVLIGIAAFVWLIVLLVTTAQSPTKQGLHDRYAHSVVVKAGRAVS